MALLVVPVLVWMSLVTSWMELVMRSAPWTLALIALEGVVRDESPPHPTAGHPVALQTRSSVEPTLLEAPPYVQVHSHPMADCSGDDPHCS